MNKRGHVYKIKENVTLKCTYNNNSYTGDVFDEREIEGKQFWVVKMMNRTDPLLLSKDSYKLIPQKSAR